jgi:hypothetical protein
MTDLLADRDLRVGNERRLRSLGRYLYMDGVVVDAGPGFSTAADRAKRWL